MSKKEYKGSGNAGFKGRQNAYGMHFTDRSPCVVGIIVRIATKILFVTNFSI